MKISSRVDYALSCLLRVADQYGAGQPVSVRHIAWKERLTADYVERLMNTMKRAGIVKSVRGVNGGYILAAAPKEITVYEVVEAVEHDILELLCFREKGRREKCYHSDDCKIRDFWLGLKDTMETFLEKHTLKDLLVRRKKEKDW